MYLQREHGHPVAHVATDYMALNREHPAFALHVGLAVVAGGHSWCYGLRQSRPLAPDPLAGPFAQAQYLDLSELRVRLRSR